MAFLFQTIEMDATLIIKGLVQGVGFRYWTKRTAENLDIRGTVQNRQDGSVIAHISGEHKNIMQFIDLCRSGPKVASVTEMIIQYDKLPPFDGFDIIR